MKNIYLLMLIVLTHGLTACQQTQSNAQTQTNGQTDSNTNAQKILPVQTKLFSTLTEKEKTDYAAAKIDEITMKISGKKYPFDANFKIQVVNYLDAYATRAGNKKTNPFTEDLNFIMQRGLFSAPEINPIFDKHGVSRLTGLYLAMIESEFNSGLVSPTGNSGIFMLTSAQARKYGITPKDRDDLKKAAEAAAQILVENQKKFESDNMKEFLALLAHNRDSALIVADLNRKFMADFKDCSLCGMTQNAAALDKQFQAESVKYIPKFLAAAIVGENPQDFGLKTKPLSTLGAEAAQ
jgi:hypothetical protein